MVSPHMIHLRKARRGKLPPADFARIFSLIDPQNFQECFVSWMKSVANLTEGEVIAIDGKSLKHSYDKKFGNRAINMVSAWATSNKLVLGQIKVDKKSNEITAIPELIKVLDVAGCIVTIDAIGCQKEIVNLISQKDGDYIIALKKNQKSLYESTEILFQEAISKRNEGFKASRYSTREMGHGREEIRNYLMLTDISSRVDPENKWKKLNSIGMVESVRTENGKTTVETRESDHGSPSRGAFRVIILAV